MAGLAPIALAPKEGLALHQRHAGLDGARARRACSPSRTLFAAALVAGAHVGRCGQGQRHALRRAHPRAARPAAARSRSRARMRAADRGQRHPRLAHRLATARCRTPIRLRCQPQVMGACARPDAPRRRDAADRGERRYRQPARSSPRSGEILSGGNFHAEPVAFAADILAHRRRARSARSPSGASRFSSIRR